MDGTTDADDPRRSGTQSVDGRDRSQRYRTGGGDARDGLATRRRGGDSDRRLRFGDYRTGALPRRDGTLCSVETARETLSEAAARFLQSER
jgi:hypothetical protein